MFSEFSKFMDLFKVPTANELAKRELAEAERELLYAYSAQEAATALVQRNEDRIARLGSMLGVPVTAGEHS